MSPYHQPLMPNESYHLFSRAIGNEKLFLSSENYLFFLKRLKQHTANVCQLYCYSLLPNHFHLLIKIYDQETIIKNFEAVKKISYLPLKHNLSDFIMERFSNLLNSYTKAINKRYNRKGGLFIDYIKRSKVNTPGDFTGFIWYIHKNAIHHQITKTIGQWQYDSYTSILSKAPTALLKAEIIDWFGSKEEYIKFHDQPIIIKPSGF